jgi:hypothetical protein
VHQTHVIYISSSTSSTSMAGKMWILKGIVVALLLPLLLSEGQGVLPAKIPQGIMPAADGAVSRASGGICKMQPWQAPH